MRFFTKPRIEEPRLIVYRYHRVENHPPKPSREQTPRAELVRSIAVYQREQTPSHGSREGQYFLAWDVRIMGGGPVLYFRFLLDAVTGNLIQAIDLAQYASGTAKVFDPNPIVTSGNTSLSSTSPQSTINGQQVGVALSRLDAADSSGNLHLDGQYVRMEEIESPTFAEPTSATGDFSFSWDAGSFLDAMAYFHIDRFQDYIQTTLGLSNVANISMQVDPQGYNGGDNSHYIGGGRITYGGPAQTGNPIPDAADAMVVLHEYGHAIQDNVNPGFDNPVDGTGEGFGDFLAAVYYDDKHTVPANTRGIMMSWDANTTDHSWPGRRYDVNWQYGDTNYNASTDNHYHGQFWCATTFELYRKLGGDSQYSSVKSAARDLAIRLHLMANFNVPASNSTSSQMAQQMEAADRNLGGWRYANGLHRKVIYDTFRRRNVPNFPALPVDVYINDGRNGGYGSLTGNDLFTERLFLDNYWTTQDLWVKVVPYATAADQQAGDPGDHVEPPVGSLAYVGFRFGHGQGLPFGPDHRARMAH
jgi:hypothetical protein